jgi:hypothetical protein
MQCSNHEEVLVRLAMLMHLTPTQAVALPLTIEVAASKVGYTESDLIAAACEKPAVLDFLAGICRKVTA